MYSGHDAESGSEEDAEAGSGEYAGAGAGEDAGARSGQDEAKDSTKEGLLGQMSMVARAKPDNHGQDLATAIAWRKQKVSDSEDPADTLEEINKVDDDGVLDEANLLWDELMQLKNQPKNLDPGTNPIIDINGQ